jgi:hypothetical protein
MDYQRMLFDWAAAQSGLTGLAILVGGLLYAFCGFRLIRYLLAVPAAGLGAFLGLHAWTYQPQLPVWMFVGAGGIVGGVAAFAIPAATVAVCSGATWGAVGGYLAVQLGAGPLPAAIALGVCGIVGVVLGLISRAPMIVLFTTLQGAALLVIGFVGVASAVLPSLGGTFRALAQSQSLVVPTLLGMLTVTGFSYQASARQGDMFTGSTASPPV